MVRGRCLLAAYPAFRDWDIYPLLNPKGREGQLQEIMTFHPLMFSSKRARVEQYSIRAIA
jgi:hypothetical protein